MDSCSVRNRYIQHMTLDTLEVVDLDSVVVVDDVKHSTSRDHFE